jgi:hypothetical protein
MPKVDNLVERLVAAAPKLRLLRLGHPARLLPQARVGWLWLAPPGAVFVPVESDYQGRGAATPRAVCAKLCVASKSSTHKPASWQTTQTSNPALSCWPNPKVLDSSLEAHVLRSDNSALAKDCRK